MTRIDGGVQPPKLLVAVVSSLVAGLNLPLETLDPRG